MIDRKRLTRSLLTAVVPIAAGMAAATGFVVWGRLFVGLIEVMFGVTAGEATAAFTGFLAFFVGTFVAVGIGAEMSEDQ